MSRQTFTRFLRNPSKKFALQCSKRRGGGSTAFWTMFKITADLAKEGTPYCLHAGNQGCEQATVCWYNEHQANKRHHEVIIFSGIISIQLTRRSILKFVMDQNIIRLTLPSSHLNWNRCNYYSTTDGVTVVMWRFYMDSSSAYLHPFNKASIPTGKLFPGNKTSIQVEWPSSCCG